jgi:two-component system NtrC family sensor kinase
MPSMIMQYDDFSLSEAAPAPAARPPAALRAPSSPLARLQYLVDNVPCIIYCTVPSGDFKMTFVSNSAYQVLGYRPEEMVADANFWFDHIHPDDAPNIFSSLARLFVDDARTYEYRFRAADGNYLWMHDSLRLIRDEDGAPLEVIGSLTDISERKRMELALGQEQNQLITRLQEAHDQLLQAEKMASIGQLAAGIAHEINNPVGFVNSNMGSLRTYVATLCRVIGAYEQALRAQGASPGLVAHFAEVREQAELDYVQEDVTELIKESMDGLQRVKDIVQALKDFSHVDKSEWQVADLHAGLDSTLIIVANEIKYKANVEKHYGKIPEIACLASQLNQVFMNLLVNAAHAIKERGVITIRSGVDGDTVWVAIGDSGCGIAPENLNRIFEPFFTTKPVGSGTGLGLSLSYGIVKKHGGRIDVASIPGAGTTFTVRLPIVQGDAAG